MNEFVKKLQASKPDLEGDAAYTAWQKTAKTLQGKAYLFHSYTHGHEEIFKLIDSFMSAYAKIGKSDSEFIYSYQPYAILKWESPNPQDEDAILSWWAMMYSNGMITYVENGVSFDIMIYISIEDVEKVMGDGQETQEVPGQTDLEAT